MLLSKTFAALTRSMTARRPRSLSAMMSRASISSSQLTIERTANNDVFESRPAKEDLVFGKTFADHMLMIEWDQENEWNAPTIVPYQDLKISPAASALHYGMSNEIP